MAVLPAKPFILRVLYPTLVSTSTPSSLPVLGIVAMPRTTWMSRAPSNLIDPLVHLV